MHQITRFLIVAIVTYSFSTHSHADFRLFLNDQGEKSIRQSDVVLEVQGSQHGALMMNRYSYNVVRHLQHVRVAIAGKDSSSAKGSSTVVTGLLVSQY